MLRGRHRAPAPDDLAIDDDALQRMELIAELQWGGVISSVQVSELQAVLRAARTIGAATGILMSRFGLSQERANDLIRQGATARNLTVGEVAHKIIETRGRAFTPPSPLDR
ncbi:ANTAR domain-containing protein [Phycicoccus sp. MAQZ13P-2]|uniref:ANTAR domain-containing protein n=1 Tax=Phycicoccus mangrovi TaxID=2840470 RepID=UPI001C0051A0|nr:ANTAR domain-containing protein [Phycicoccus mangrovi]MBT9273690.1 ANTAR domain-containing protein [Phycicoccus mangrovi]